MANQTQTSPPTWRKLLARRRFYLGLQFVLAAILIFWGVRFVDCYLETHNLVEAAECTFTFGGGDPSIADPKTEGVPTEGLVDDTSLRLPQDSLRTQQSPIVALPEAEIIHENIDDLKAEWYQAYGVIAKIVIIILIITFLIFYEIYHQNRKRLFADEEDQLAPPYFWKVRTKPGVDFNLVKEDDFFEASRRVIENLAMEGSLPIQPEGGIPLVVLIERKAPQDHLAMLIDQVLLDLSKQHISVKRFFFEQDPRLVWSEQYSQEFLLDELRQKHPDHHLILVGGTKIFFDPVTDAFADWMSMLKDWPKVVHMTTSFPITWSRREIRLAKRLTLMPASFDALTELPRIFAGKEAPSLRHWLRQNHYPEPPDEHSDDLVKALHLYFDTEMDGLTEQYVPDRGKPLFDWLCMCAVYPELSWDLTLALGYALGAQRTQSLVTPKHVLRLASLEWFRRGEIPDHIRELLTAQLSKDDFKLTLRTILNLLKKNPPPEGSFAAEEHKLRITVLDAQVNPAIAKDIRLIQEVQDFCLNHELKDPLVIKYLQGLPRLVPAMPSVQSIYRTTFEQGVPILGFQSWLRLSIGVITILLVALTLDPSRLDRVYHVDGERYLLNSQTDKMRFYAYQGEKYLQAGDYVLAEASLNEAIRIQEEIKDETYLTPRYNLAYLELARGNSEPAKDNFATLSEEADDLLATNETTRSPETIERLQEIKGASEYVQAVEAHRSMELEEAEDKARESVKTLTRIDNRALDVRYAEGVIWLERGIMADSGAVDYLALAEDRFQELQKDDPSYFKRNRALYPIIDSLSKTRSELRPALSRLMQTLEGKRPQPETLAPQPTAPRQLNYDQLSPYQDGYALVRGPEGGYAFMDRQGSIKGTYRDARPFSEGLAAVKIGALWGFINTQRLLAIEPQYTAAREFRQGFATVKQQGYWGLIDQQGQVSIPFIYERPIVFEDERETPPKAKPLAVVRRNGAFQYISRQGELAFEGRKFEYAANFRGNVAQVKRWKTFYYMNHLGECIPASIPTKECPQEQWRSRLVETIESHAADIDVARFAPNGQFFATAGADSTIQIHRANGKELMNTFRTQSRIRALAIGPQSTRIVSGGDNKELIIWEVGGAIFRRHPLRGAIWSLTFSPDGKYLVAGTDGGIVYLLDMRDGHILREIRTENDIVRVIAFHPSLEQFVIGGAEGLLRVYDLQGKLMQEISYPGILFGMNYRPDGQRLAVAGRGKVISIIDMTLPKPRVIQTLKGHGDWISEVSYSPDGSYLLSSSYDRSLRIWNEAGQVVLSLKQPYVIRGATFSPDGQQIVTAGWGTNEEREAVVYELRRF